MRRKNHGFTLIELLVVISIVGFLMSLGVSFLASAGRGNMLIQTSNQMASLCASARNASVGNDRAFVVLEGLQKGGVLLRDFRFHQVFNWNCEDLSRASEDVLMLSGVAMGEGDSPSGEGRHVTFNGGATLNLGNYSWLQMKDGIDLKVRLRPEKAAGSGGITLFNKRGSYQVRLRRGSEGGYDVEVEVKLEQVRPGGAAGQTQSATLVTGFRDAAEIPEWRQPLHPGRWYDLRISYDRNELSIFVDGRVRGQRTDLNWPLNLEDTPLLIGEGYVGGFDSLVISGIFEEDDDRFESHPTVDWVDADGKPKGGLYRIHYRSRRLDPRHHQGAVTVRFRLEGERGASRTIRIALSGELFIERVGR
ncbi:MAG: prepilin-type N-terminal cleavage/methylation domain-containing protein [Planctomycetota bacterium]|nr:prepilin-type N-terminal cleavage/methylation domain-containing protein [Planctomycetota bacterium]